MDQKNILNKKEMIKDIEPVTMDGNVNINIENDFCYDLFIEYPVRDACRKLNELGIQTIMSSANRIDASKKDEPQKMPGRDYLFEGPDQHFKIGNGYAWIMIDYQKLSEENKQLLDDLNSGNIPITLSPSEMERFRHNCRVNNTNVTQSELVKYYMVVYNTLLSTANSSKSNPIRKKQMASIGLEATTDNYLKYYQKNGELITKGYIEKEELQAEVENYFNSHSEVLYNKNSLSYHGEYYPAVALKYPIDENTRVDEVINYFKKLTSLFKDNRKQYHK